MPIIIDDLPPTVIILNVLHVVEYIDPMDDKIYRVDLSRDNRGEDLPMGKQLELIEWARSFAISPLIAEMVHDYVHGELEGDDGDVPAT